MLTLSSLGVAFLFGIGMIVGYMVRQAITQHRKNSLELRIKQLLLDARAEAQETLLGAKEKAAAVLETTKHETRSREQELRKLEERIRQKEEAVEKRTVDIEQERKELHDNREQIKRANEEIAKQEEEKIKELQRVAGLTEKEAREMLFTSIEKRYQEDLLARLHKLEVGGEEMLEKRARDILASVIQRVATPTTSEVTTTTVTIPSEDLKGKIIGREGRNIRALERAAGVEVIIDETPGTIIISGFDPVRRHVAKMALEDLIIDGRIQPARIEETVEKARQAIDKIMKEAGNAAAYEVGVFDLDPKLIQLLGRLTFRTSYGQNVLHHSIEMTHISGMLAAELGADVAIAKKGALLHDIGKAVDHEVQGTHVEIGRRILQKFNVEKPVIQAMQSHHEEYPYETLESIIVQTADAVSAGRPGARRDTVEHYLKRLEDLEAIANSFEGIEKSYAIQAGREIRIFVSPEKVSDFEAKNLARNIAGRIEQELKYPGEIKVHVIRESRVVEYAR